MMTITDKNMVKLLAWVAKIAHTKDNERLTGTYGTFEVRDGALYATDGRRGAVIPVASDVIPDGVYTLHTASKGVSVLCPMEDAGGFSSSRALAPLLSGCLDSPSVTLTCWEGTRSVNGILAMVAVATADPGSATGVLYPIDHKYAEHLAAYPEFSGLHTITIKDPGAPVVFHFASGAKVVIAPLCLHTKTPKSKGAADGPPVP